jgi:hypothetical protein
MARPPPRISRAACLGLPKVLELSLPLDIGTLLASGLPDLGTLFASGKLCFKLCPLCLRLLFVAMGQITYDWFGERPDGPDWI